jgi:hypothetical protein
MSSNLLPCVICGGLITIALSCVASAAYLGSNAITATTVTTLLIIASNVVSGLLGYVTSAVTPKEPK